jgi:hypothetical protein
MNQLRATVKCFAGGTFLVLALLYLQPVLPPPTASPTPNPTPAPTPPPTPVPTPSALQRVHETYDAVVTQAGRLNVTEIAAHLEEYAQRQYTDLTNVTR